MNNLARLSDAFEVLDHNQMRKINGGIVFECYCGHVGGQWESFKFYNEYDSITDALNGEANGCGGLGVTCSGV
ncbi:hypothetical protein QYR09_02125 [Cellulophaga lytica]|nr:hypothetical protein QYR09_02125 [Cellulophaga lytica]